MRSMMSRITLCWIALALASCGSPPDDAGDAGPVDEIDASIPADSGGELDTGPRDAGPLDAGPPDAGPPDTDGDGVSDDRDCAPDDDTIGAEASRDCSTACGEGTEDCAAGLWAECTAPTACLCDAPGMRRIVTCGMCGEQSEECTDRTWQPVSSCLGQGPCEPGSVETQTGFRCRVDERLCRTDCSWSDWSVVVPFGECTPGTRRCDPVYREDMLCTDECIWIDNPDCDVNP